ncbi:LCP family protein [Leifsonia aquatica]|uniref:LCP family protein n=1 Tax=Leifsonia aquatica TaxID=144185 RepID=UPI0004683F1F|nr:LCP family protein [Leifsonia aquatica]
MRRGTKIALWSSGIFLGVVAALVAAVLLFVTSLANAFNANSGLLADAFPSEGARPAPSADGSMNILLLGSDSRRELAAIGDTEALGQRADTIMVVHVPANRKDVQVMSIMRDSWVDIPGHGKNKINAAFAWGGSSLIVQTVENLLEARIDHVALIGFDGFSDMTNALGGVTVHSEKAFSAHGQEFVQGANYLNGEQALLFVRARYAFADGDYQRVRNQQAFLRAIAEEAISAKTLTSPERIYSFTTATTKHLSVDSGFTFQTMFELGISLRNVRADGITFFTIPTAGTGVVGDQSVVFVDQEKLPGLRKAFAEDTLHAF